MWKVEYAVGWTALHTVHANYNIYILYGIDLSFISTGYLPRDSRLSPVISFSFLIANCRERKFFLLIRNVSTTNALWDLC